METGIQPYRPNDDLKPLDTSIGMPKSGIAPEAVWDFVIHLMRSPGESSWCRKKLRNRPSAILLSPFCVSLHLAEELVEFAGFAPKGSDLAVHFNKSSIVAFKDLLYVLKSALNSIISSDEFRHEEDKHRPQHSSPYTTSGMEALYQSWADRRLSDEEREALAHFREITTQAMDLVGFSATTYFSDSDEAQTLFEAARSDYCMRHFEYIAPKKITAENIVMEIGTVIGLSPEEIKARYPKLFPMKALKGKKSKLAGKHTKELPNPPYFIP